MGMVIAIGVGRLQYGPVVLRIVVIQEKYAAVRPVFLMNPRLPPPAAKGAKHRMAATGPAGVPNQAIALAGALDTAVGVAIQTARTPSVAAAHQHPHPNCTLMAFINSTTGWKVITLA